MVVSARRRVELRAESRATARDIGELPPVVNPKRRKACGPSLLRFCKTYLKTRFVFEFSPDHLKLIEDVESAILTGGMKAIAMPRGSGKSAIIQAGGEWATLYQHRRFIVIVANGAREAKNMLVDIKATLADNDLLAEDFPEACYPIRALGGIPQRAAMQTYQGERTGMEWKGDTIRLAQIEGGGGTALRTVGITGSIRGAKVTLTDGTQIRPDLVLIDDPQDDESAKSVSQVATRLATVNSTILGLAGPGTRISALCACTVIATGDLADQLTDRKTNPAWRGTRVKMLRAWPKNMNLWDQYAEMYREDQRTESGHDESRAFYKKNRAAMDEGAEHYWAARVDDDDLSALQSAMNWRADKGHDAFNAEMQNEPRDPFASADVEQITAPAVLRKLNGMERGIVPIEATILTAGIDVQGAALYWGVAAWTPGFSGDAVAYGCYPDQGRPYFTVQEIEKTLAKSHPGASWEASLYAGLDALVNHLADREWVRDDGGTQRLDRIIIDAGYGDSTDTVYQFCRRSKHSAILLPFFGRTVAAGAAAMDEWKKKPGDQIGSGWRIPKPTNRPIRHILADVNKWKSFLADRILAPPGGAGSFGVYGRANQAAEHRMLADQLAAELRTRVLANGRTADQWRPKPNRDNHWLDVFTMAAVAASTRGVKLDEQAVVRAIRAATSNDQPGPAQPPTPPRRPGPRRPRGGGFLTGFGFGGGAS